MCTAEILKPAKLVEVLIKIIPSVHLRVSNKDKLIMGATLELNLVHPHIDRIVGAEVIIKPPCTSPNPPNHIVALGCFHAM